MQPELLFIKWTVLSLALLMLAGAVQMIVNDFTE